MKLIIIKSIFLALAGTTGVDAATTLRSRNVQNGEDPLSLNNVVKRIAKHVWSDGYPRQFIIKGSYPASMYAYEHSNLELPFNDIDVLIDIPESSECKDETYSKYESQFGFSRFIDSSFVDDLLPGSSKQVQVVRLCDIDHPEDLITKYSDINAIEAGFIVTPDDSSGEPVIEKWVTSPKYEDFLQTKTLEVVTRKKPTQMSHESTIVRLLDKAQRLNMDYIVPEWLDSLHGDVMLPIYKRLLDTLDDQYKDVVYSRFDLMPIHDNKLYMFVGKGKDIPKVPPIDDSPLFKYSSQSESCTSNCSQNGNSGSSLDNCTEQCNCNGVKICIMPKCTKNCNSNGGRKAEMPMCEYNCNCHSKICKMAGRNDLAAIS